MTSLRLLPLEQDAPRVALALQQIGGSGALFLAPSEKKRFGTIKSVKKNSAKSRCGDRRRANLCDHLCDMPKYLSRVR